MDAALQSTTILTPQDNAEPVGVEGNENGVPSATAHNVTSLLMGLNSSVANNINLTSSASSSFSPTSSYSSTGSHTGKKQTHNQVSVSTSAVLKQASHTGLPNASRSQTSINSSYSNNNRDRDQLSASASDMWPRGRRAHESASNGTWGPSGPTQQGLEDWIDSTTEDPLVRSNGHGYEKRNTSPVSTRVRMPASSASSVAPSVKSKNWRNSSLSSHSSSTTSSAFTRFSNSSARSVSTAATSVSASDSWRNVSSTSLASSAHKPPQHDLAGRPPSNVKRKLVLHNQKVVY